MGERRRARAASRYAQVAAAQERGRNCCLRACGSADLNVRDVGPIRLETASTKRCKHAFRRFAPEKIEHDIGRRSCERFKDCRPVTLTIAARSPAIPVTPRISTLLSRPISVRRAWSGNQDAIPGFSRPAIRAGSAPSGIGTHKNDGTEIRSASVPYGGSGNPEYASTPSGRIGRRRRRPE